MLRHSIVMLSHPDTMSFADTVELIDTLRCFLASTKPPGLWLVPLQRSILVHHPILKILLKPLHPQLKLHISSLPKLLFQRCKTPALSQNQRHLLRYQPNYSGIAVDHIQVLYYCRQETPKNYFSSSARFPRQNSVRPIWVWVWWGYLGAQRFPWLIYGYRLRGKGL